MDKFGFLKVAVAIPQVHVADCNYNAEHIVALIQKAVQRGVEIMVLPELSITAYTCGDLFLQSTLLTAADEALAKVVARTRKLPITIIVGLPVSHGNELYNCAVVFTQGRIMGVVPKINIPNYSEFYEGRWFSSGAGVASDTTIVGGQECDFGTNLLFDVNGVEFGVEICEDLWTAIPPSSNLALEGAKVIFNLSASPETVGKYAYLKNLVAQQSARTHTAYVYCSSGVGESSTDLVFTGNGIIAEDGTILRSSERFSQKEQLIVADVDIERLNYERRRITTFRATQTEVEMNVIEMEVPQSMKASKLDRDIDPMPFVPSADNERRERCKEVFDIQSSALAQRLRHTECKRAVIGISGGLDSTLALMVSVRAFDMLGLDRKGIIGIAMPGFGTTDRTHSNATDLMRQLGVTSREISINKSCEQHFADIGLNPDDRSVAYENAQARERTQILMDVANMECGMVIGTGDLSELALGWATYNGDHMSMYGVNCSVPKTLVGCMVKWIAETSKDKAMRKTLLDIVDTPISPELLPAEGGDIAQKTEDLVGPYELHDFFLYHILRCGATPEKILFLATQAFHETHDMATIRKWLQIFLRRFFSQQFKRSASPDGPKVSSVSLSPRGDWRMPSDACATVWLDNISD